MCVFHRNAIPFFQRLTVSWSLPFARIIFFTVNEKVLCMYQGSGEESVLKTPVTLRTCYIKSLKCHEGSFLKELNQLCRGSDQQYLVGNTTDHFSYQSSYKITVGSV